MKILHFFTVKLIPYLLSSSQNSVLERSVPEVSLTRWCRPHHCLDDTWASDSLNLLQKKTFQLGRVLVWGDDQQSPKIHGGLPEMVQWWCKNCHCLWRWSFVQKKTSHNDNSGQVIVGSVDGNRLWNKDIGGSLIRLCVIILLDF